MTRKLENVLTHQRKKTQKKNLRIAGSLGIPLGGQREVEVANRNSFVYVRLRDNQSEVIQAFNNTVAPSYGLPVFVERKGNQYSVVAVDTARYQNNWNSFSPYLSRHGNTHSFDLESGGGGDIVWVYPRQFMPLLGLPSGSIGGPNIIVSSYTLESISGTWRHFGNTGTQNFTPYIPTSPTGAVMVLTYLDIQDGNPKLIVNSGSVFSNSITGTAQIVPFIPTVPRPSTQIPIAAIRLVTGTNAISWNNIYDVRQFLNLTVTGSGGGGTSVPTLLSGSIALADSNGLLTSRPWLKYEDANEAIVLGANRIKWLGNAGKIYYSDEALYILGAGAAFPRVTEVQDNLAASWSASLNFISGVAMVIDGVGQNGLTIREDHQDVFHVNTSGTAHSNNVPLVKEAPINSKTYGRSNSGWEPVVSLPIPNSYIDGLGINYISSGSISVNPGTAYIPGLEKFVIVTGAITQNFPLPGPTGTWQHVYLWENATIPSIQVTGAVPSNPYSGRARTKSGDSNYRYLGSLLPDNAGFIHPFVAGVVGGSIDITWKTQNSNAPFALPGTITTAAPVTVSIAGLIPVSGIPDGIYIIGQLTVPAGTVGAAGIGGTLLTYIANPFQSGDSYFRLENQSATQETSFFPPSLIKITGNTIQAAVNVTTVSLTLRSNGIRIPRS